MTASFRFSTASEVQHESAPEFDIVSFMKSTVDELEGISCYFVAYQLNMLIYVVELCWKGKGEQFIEALYLLAWFFSLAVYMSVQGLVIIGWTNLKGTKISLKKTECSWYLLDSFWKQQAMNLSICLRK